MYIEKDFEPNYEQEIYKSSLQFRNNELESQYMNYKFNKRKTPHWFKWLHGTLFIFFIGRRIQSLIFSLINSPYALSSTQYIKESLITSVCIMGIIGEILASYLQRFKITRGFWIMTMWNIVIPYSSYAYYPNTVALLPTGGSAYVLNVLTCTWYIYTWKVSIVASVIGIIFTSIFTQMSGLIFGIFLLALKKNI